MAAKNFFKKFFMKEYQSFEKSQLEFRLEILKVFQYSFSIFLILFMVIVFPILKLNLFYYICMPLGLVFNFLVICLIKRKKYQRFVHPYLFFIQVFIQIVGLEFAASITQNYSSKRALIMGLQAGILQSICFLNLCSSLLKFASSIFMFTQIIVRLIAFETENLYTSVLIILCALLLVNFINYRFEMLNFSVWNSYMKSTTNLKHFQKIIDIFPSQIAVINKASFCEDNALYFNQEAEKLMEHIFGAKTKSLKALMDSFKIETDSFHEMLEGGSVKLKKTLKSFVEQLLLLPSTIGDFQKIISEFKGFKWEVKFGWIEWNNEIALILIFSDISKNEKITVLENLDKKKDRVLATVSHELKTPLNAVIGMIDVSIEEIPENLEAVKKYLKIARDSAKSLSLMINNILDMELLRKGKLYLNMIRIPLNDIIENTLPLARVLAKKKLLEFIYQNDCPENTTLFVDPLRLQQIIVNILDNAIKFTSQGFIKFSIKPKKVKDSKDIILIEREKNKENYLFPNTTQMDSEMLLNVSYRDDYFEFFNDKENQIIEENLIKICVEDTGLGISEEKKKSLFNIFGKVETNLSVRGMGLGLAISQSLALKMGSTGIFLKSKQGKGSKFYFTIKASFTEIVENTLRNIPDEHKSPILLNDFATIFKTNHTEDDNTRETFEDNMFKILVVDDDEANHLVISLYLKAHSNTISTDKAYNGKHALSQVLETAESKRFYDLIIMDCDMPIMNGFEATDALMELVKQGKIPEIKVVALTANASISNRECCMSHGMLDVWDKPISKVNFLKRLIGFLPKKLAEKIKF